MKIKDITGHRLGEDAVPRRSPLLDNPAFKAWFKNSKVVDRFGNPLVVYHGTFGSGDPDGDEDDDYTSDSRGYRQFDDVNRNGGFWFTTNPHYANDFTNGGMGEIYPVYLSVQNPLAVRLDDIESPSESLINRAMNGGYDGLFYHGPGDANGGQWFVFSPNQIKSATGNRGTFNAGSPHIGEAQVKR